MVLEHSNLFYRAPALYDQVQAGLDHASAKLCEELIETHGISESRVILDLGCGTGRDLERLAARFDCVGVDLQPQMVEYAHQVRPELDIRVGDLRSIRLGQPADAILCLGNTLAYLHDNADLQAAFATFAAHAHPGTLLVLFTPVTPIQQAEPHTARVDTDDLHAHVTINYEWDLRTQINTMQRHWRLDDGTEHRDEVRRRILGPREVELYATLAGFEVAEVFSTLDREELLRGSSAYVVALFRST